MQVRLRACCVLPVAGVHEPFAKNVDEEDVSQPRTLSQGKPVLSANSRYYPSFETQVWRTVITKHD